MQTASLLNDLNLTREEQFIITCLRSEFGKEGNNALASFDLESLNWDTVFKKSEKWRITEWLYTIIKKQASVLEMGKIPELFVETIRLKYFMTSVANDSMFKSLYEVLEVFQKAGIKVILLKGSHLAQLVYQDDGVRPMIDVDILVKKDDLQKAEALLLHMGYNNQQENTKGGTRHHLPAFFHPKRKEKLELHWTIQGLFWKFNIDLEGIWERAKAVRKDGMDMLVFSLEDLLLHLSLHAVYHHKLRDMGLMPYCDIATIINDYSHEFDYDQLQARAREWGIEKYLNLSLYLSHEILGVKVPGNILRDFRAEPLNKNVVSEASKRILSVTAQKSPYSGAPYPFADGFHPSDNIMRRMLFIFKMIFISPKALAALYSLPGNAKYIYLYYGIRFFSLPYRYILYYAKFTFYRLIHIKEQDYERGLDMWLRLSERK